MDADLQTPVPDNGESKATFRKPSSDAANRKYRRHSPVGGSSSSDGSLKREHSGSPTSLDDPGRDPEHRSWRDDVKERGRDYGKSLHGKSGDSYRHSDRQSYRSSHGYSRHEDYIRHDKFAYEDRNHERLSSRPVRESSGGTHSDHTRHDSEHGRPKDYTHNVDKYSRDRYDVSGYRSKENVRETSSLEHKKYNKDSSYDRAGSGSRHAHSDKVDRDRQTRDRDGRDGNKDYHRSSGDRKSKQAISYDQSKERWNGSNSRIDGKHCLKEACKSDLMGLGDQKSTREEKKRYDDSEKDKDQHTRETREQIRSEKESPAKKLKLFDERKASSSKQSQEDKVNLVSVQDGGSDADNDLNAAKVAAMKAAELVNRNLVGVGYMTADQKKKLLWGNKKTTTTEESGNRWDTTLFPDRERQEKFNKLMSLRLHWCLWPIVGCERRYEGGAKTQQPRRKRSPCREGEGTPAGFGEAVHCWSSTKRWPYRWIRTLNIHLDFYTSFHICVLVVFYSSARSIVLVLGQYMFYYILHSTTWLEFLEQIYIVLITAAGQNLLLTAYCLLYIVA